ncbi:sugar transferase [Paenibacillus ihuae]|uniref:sugar transferase n=1 Tax=Paenibacillus ihuae TaxID=1232431 RepID=UPI0006D5385F|nr:sugar transferase [Paenibacillus ihuae]
MIPSQSNEAELTVNSTGYYVSTGLKKQRKQLFYLMVKRSLDITAAGAGLICLAPFLLLLSLMILVEDPKGRVFFSQVRIGKDQKPFRIYKFRSMISNAEELLDNLLGQNEIRGAMFKMKDDPRITRVGRFMRKTSLDELPQLFNVLKGDMSLVGPRPPLVREVAEYTEYDKQRLVVTPGCTGLWQVSGRNGLSFADMVELDLSYIDNRGFLLDMKIIFKTFKVLIGSKDAY